jgi:hypothetical protein
MTSRANWNWVAAACLVVGLVYVNHRDVPALAAASEPAAEAGQTVEPAGTSGTRNVQPASGKDVEHPTSALEEDPFLQHRDWFQEVANGPAAVTKDTLDAFLATLRYPSRRVEGEGDWRVLEIPYGPTTALVFVTLSTSSRKLWLRLDLRKLDAAVTSSPDRLFALLRDSGKGGQGFLRITGDNTLSLCDRVETDGLTKAGLEQAVTWLIEQAERTADVWRG